RRLTVELPSEAIDQKVAGRLNELRGQVRLKGFRPGKVPLNVVRQRYGNQVRAEVLQEAMQNGLRDAVEQEKLRIAGVSSMNPESDGDGEAFRFTAEVEVYPELPEIEVGDLEIERPAVEIEEQDVDEMIQTLREQRRAWSSAGRAAAEGDRVSIEFSAEVDGERHPESGTRSLRPVLGSDALFDDFEQALTGVEDGVEKDLELAFPEDFGDPGLAGRTAQVSFKVIAIESSSLPEADDEFAESFGIDGGMEQMRVDVRRNLEREMRQARTNKLKKRVTDGLAERYSEFALPEAAVRQEMDQMLAQLRQQYGEKIELPTDQLRPGAERRVRLGFLLAEIARQHDISVDPARVDAQINDIADTYENPGEVVELYRSNPNLRSQIENAVLEEQVVDWVLENAKVSDQEMSFKQLMESA
ncbi:MAG: trigger factor, partial [Wenzhouxiangellaceae bacterium]